MNRFRICELKNQLQLEEGRDIGLLILKIKSKLGFSKERTFFLS